MANDVDMTHMHLHLVDKRVKSDSNHLVPMPVIDQSVGQSEADLYAVASDVLFALWCDALLVPSLDRADTLFNSSRRRKDPNNMRKTYNKNIINRSVVRGGMIMALIDTVGEGILASSGIRDFLSSP